MMRRLNGLRMPSPEPIGAASGMTAGQPRSSSRLHATGSSVMYGSTWKPSRTSTRAASMVAGMSGKSVFSSPITSSLTSVPTPASRASRHVRIASSAV